MADQTFASIMDAFAKSMKESFDGFGKKFDAMCEKMDAEKKARKDAPLGAETDATGNPRTTTMDADDLRSEAGTKPSVTPTGTDRQKFTEAQQRADSAYQAFGDSAPHSLHGESLRSYRCRLAGALKHHSPMYKNSDLFSIGDEAALTNVEIQVYHDAVEASTTPPPAGAPLRQVTTMDESGRRVTKFFGDPLVAYAPFMFGGLVQYGRITPQHEFRNVH